MKNSENNIGNIKNSNIGEISQTIIENQKNNTNITNNQVNLIVTGGDFTEVALSHDLFPHYIVATKKMHNGKYALVSKPVDEEALKKYPCNFKSSFKVIDKRFKDIKDPDLLLDMLQYADSPVEIEITKFEQYLGNIIDPYPNPDLNPSQEGTKTYIMPQNRPLPKVEMNINIIFDNSDFKLKDLHLNLTKQISSKKFVLDNYNQELYPVFIQLIIEFIDEKELKCTLNYKANPDTIQDSNSVCIFNEFALNLLTKRYSIYDTSKNKEILSGKSNVIYEKSKIEGLKNYIHLIKAIIEIENYFSIKFEIPNKISEDDVDTIKDLYKKIQDSKNRVSAIDVSFSVIKKGADINQLKQLCQMKQTSILTTHQDIIYNILNVDIKIKKIIEKYDFIKCSNISEIEDFIEHFDSLDDNYELKIVMVSAKGKNFYKYTEIIKWINT